MPTSAAASAGVVHAVADHDRHAVLASRLDRGELVRRRLLGAHVGHAEQFADRQRDIAPVAGQHHEALDAFALE
jgi:hypothetical protein